MRPGAAPEGDAMNEVIKQDDRYPEWMKAWNAKSLEIDAQLISFCLDTTEHTGEALDAIGLKLQDWWDQQLLDDITKAEYEQAKKDTALFKAQIESRIAHLVQDGKIQVAPPTAKGGPSATAPLPH
jgi:hypothetical protein